MTLNRDISRKTTELAQFRTQNETLTQQMGILAETSAQRESACSHFLFLSTVADIHENEAEHNRQLLLLNSEAERVR